MGKKLDPRQYIIICWNDGRARSTPPHPFTVEYTISDDPPPKEDVLERLIDYRFELIGHLRKGAQVIQEITHAGLGMVREIEIGE